MKTWLIAAAAAFILIVGVWAQENPGTGSETVARPRKKPATDNSNTATPPGDTDLPKIPSKLSPKATKGEEPETDASFKAETNVVTVDVQILDNHGNPIS